MSHSVKRPKSKYEQFRMNVPEDVRAVVGKTAWTESLKTTSSLLARELRAKLVAQYTAEVRRIRAGNDRRADEAAVAMLHRAFSRLALLRGSMDTAVAEQLSLLGSFVRDSWAGTDETEQRQWWGDICLPEPTIEVEAVPSIDTEPERDIFRLRAELLEGRGIADGLVYQELARVLLVRRTLRPIWSVVSYMRSIEPGLDLEESQTRWLGEGRPQHTRAGPSRPGNGQDGHRRPEPNPRRGCCRLRHQHQCRRQDRDRLRFQEA